MSAGFFKLLQIKKKNSQRIKNSAYKQTHAVQRSPCLERMAHLVLGVVLQPDAQEGFEGLHVLQELAAQHCEQTESPSRMSE